MSASGQLLLIFHVASAMLWFGATAFVPRRVRAALELDPAAASRCLAELLRESRVLRIASTVVFATGLGMALQTGFAILPRGYHIALALTLIWLGLDHAVVGRSLRRLAAADAEGARPLAKRLTSVLAAQRVLFTAALVLMLWRL